MPLYHFCYITDMAFFKNGKSPSVPHLLFGLFLSFECECTHLGYTFGFILRKKLHLNFYLVLESPSDDAKVFLTLAIGSNRIW